MSFIHKINSVAQLNPDWNKLTTSPYQKTTFLSHCEQFNKCNQRYYELYSDNRLSAGAVVYTLPLDILTFLGIPSPINMQIVGIPASVSSQGIVGKEKFTTILLNEIKHIEKGLLLILNLDSNPDLEGFVSGYTLPTMTLQRKFNTIEEYWNTLRSSYRRRLKATTDCFEKVHHISGSCRAFNQEMYELYLSVFNKSDAKLEKLGFEFFKNLPAPFSLTAYYKHNILLGWAITVKEGENFYFFMGGINYNYNIEYKTYFNIVFGVVKEAISKGYGILDFGQTAEIPKSRLGGNVIRKYMLARHSNTILNLILNKTGHLLEYKRNIPEVHVFSKEVLK